MSVGVPNPTQLRNSLPMIGSFQGSQKEVHWNIHMEFLGKFHIEGLEFLGNFHMMDWNSLGTSIQWIEIPWELPY